MQDTKSTYIQQEKKNFSIKISTALKATLGYSRRMVDIVNSTVVLFTMSNDKPSWLVVCLFLSDFVRLKS